MPRGKSEIQFAEEPEEEARPEPTQRVTVLSPFQVVHDATAYWPNAVAEVPESIPLIGSLTAGWRNPPKQTRRARGLRHSTGGGIRRSRGFSVPAECCGIDRGAWCS
jgi:hypothetical protein